MCNDIGEASYVDSLVAAAFLETARRLPSAPAIMQRLWERYKLDLAGGCPGRLRGRGGTDVCRRRGWCGASVCDVAGAESGAASIGSELRRQSLSGTRCLPGVPTCPAFTVPRLLPSRVLPPPSSLAADYHGEEFVHALGDRMFNEEPERAGQRILKDFRSLALGRICLELPASFAASREV